jgi:hypothetical protein|tara:strand:- start:1552 stop:1767 length:216 start_codon:yes stop_codon:yes gene_type:complete
VVHLLLIATLMKMQKESVGAHQNCVRPACVDVAVLVARVQLVKSHVEDEHAKSMGTTMSFMIGHVVVVEVV